MASAGIGAKLRQERVGKGLAIDDIARDTRIAPRFLEAIETDDYSSLPGLIFARNFVRQYALILHLDPDPLLAELPKHDESTAPLPNPPAQRARSGYNRDRRLRSLVSSIAWLVFAVGVGVTAYVYFNHAPRKIASPASSAEVQIHARAAAPITPPAAPSTPNPSASTTAATAPPVQVSLTARERAWVQVSVDGKTSFIGTLTPNETKEVSAAEQVKVLTGNAGALTISLNGKTLDPLGLRGQLREVMLTAEGSRLLSKDPPSGAPDPL
ncbi:MAG TPA: RodZ domain-containing protein [Bryobacteraceae bacterium]|nr:RodZ domain-containing protein [Bryobacteraceae bacterium]